MSTTRGPKSTTSLQPVYGKKPSKNNVSTTSTTSTPEIDQRGVKNEIYPYKDYNREEVVDVVDSVDMGTGNKAKSEPAQRASVQYVGIAESGRARVGEGHQHASLTDAQVEQIRDLYEAHEPGHPLHIGYKKLAAIFNVPKRTIRDIVNYNRRNQWPAKWKRLKRRDP